MGKWTVSGNQFMSVDNIQKEEERCKREAEAEKRAYKQGKHQTLIVSEEEVMTTDDDKDAHDSILLNENSKHSSMTESDEEWDLLSVSNEVVVDTQQQSTDKADNHTDIIAELEEKVASLRKELRRLQQNNRHWKE